MKKKLLLNSDIDSLLKNLEVRFESNMHRHQGVQWKEVKTRLIGTPTGLESLKQMEETGGEPDVTGYDAGSGKYIFMDCSVETPAGRRSLCYDRESLDSRKENKPSGNAMEMAAAMGVELMDEEQYQLLQKLNPVDLKTSSWLRTDAKMRKLGGAIFGDNRFGRVFVYHNGAQSYYAARGFRCVLKI